MCGGLVGTAVCPSVCPSIRLSAGLLFHTSWVQSVESVDQRGFQVLQKEHLLLAEPSVVLVLVLMMVHRWGEGVVADSSQEEPVEVLPLQKTLHVAQEVSLAESLEPRRLVLLRRKTRQQKHPLAFSPKRNTCRRP